MINTLKRQQQSPGTPPSHALVTLPTHVIWTKEERPVEKFFARPPPHPRNSGERTPTPPTQSPLVQPEDPATATTSSDSSSDSYDPAQRIFRLERNLRFLKSQHQKMLADLHAEIEKLKSRNSELQFQLVIGTPLGLDVIHEDNLIDSKTGILPNILAEPKFLKLTIGTQTDAMTVTSKKSNHFANAEEELVKLRQALEEAENRNACLGTLIAQLKRSHVRLKSTASLTNQRLTLHSTTPQLHRQHTEAHPAPMMAQAKKLEEYEELVRNLRRENREQKQELTYVRSCLDQLPSRGRLSLTGTGNSSRLPSDPQRLPRLTEPSGSTKLIQARKTTELPRIHPRSCGSLVSRVERPRSTCEQTDLDPEDAMIRPTGWIGDPVNERRPRPPRASRRSKSKPSRERNHDQDHHL